MDPGGLRTSAISPHTFKAWPNNGNPVPRLKKATIPGIFVNRTNGYNHASETYAPASPGPSGYPVYGTEGSSQPYAFHTDGQNVLLGDGAVKFISDQIDIWVVTSLVTRNQGGVEAKISQTY